MDDFVKYPHSNLNKEPIIHVIEKIEKEGQVVITFSFPLPIIWYGDCYTYDPEHIVKDVFTGNDECSLMETIRTHVKTIITWENKRISENLGTRISEMNLMDNT